MLLSWTRQLPILGLPGCGGLGGGWREWVIKLVGAMPPPSPPQNPCRYCWRMAPKVFTDFRLDSIYSMVWRGAMPALGLANWESKSSLSGCAGKLSRRHRPVAAGRRGVYDRPSRHTMSKSRPEAGTTAPFMLLARTVTWATFICLPEYKEEHEHGYYLRGY
jgi:hypothetical protein